MCIATMIPAALPAIRHVGRNSLRRRQQRAVAGFLLTYLAVWTAAGAVTLPILNLMEQAVPQRILIITAAAGAGLWAVLPLQIKFRRACHLTVPLPPHGLRAHVACARFGLRHGLACLGVCGPLMLLMAVTLHDGLLWMVALSILVTAAKLAPRRWRPGVIRMPVRCTRPPRRPAAPSTHHSAAA